MQHFENITGRQILHSAETWFAILFTVIVEIVPLDVRSVVIGIFLFLMNNVGGNLPVIVDPVAEKYDYRTALMIFFPGFVGASKYKKNRYILSDESVFY